MIKHAIANKIDADILDEKYGVANIGCQLKMLMWRAFIAKYKVSLRINHHFKCVFIQNIIILFQDTFFLALNTSQNLMTALIFGLVYIRYPRLSSGRFQIQIAIVKFSFVLTVIIQNFVRRKGMSI